MPTEVRPGKWQVQSLQQAVNKEEIIVMKGFVQDIEAMRSK